MTGTPTFEAADEIREIAEAYALDMIDFARDNFGVTLDYSDKSIIDLEKMADVFSSQTATSTPPEETVWQFAKMFGSYLGVVYLRHHTGKWGVVTRGESRAWGIETGSGQKFWPVVRARNRLVDGPENNLEHYYQWIVDPPKGAPATP